MRSTTWQDLSYRFLVAVDIEGFSRRPPAEQAKIQEALEHAMSHAAATARLDRKRWYRQPRGDGELAVLPPDANGLSLVADYPRMLDSALADINRHAEPGARLRIRMAIHHGTVFPGCSFGPVGAAPVVVSRLVDSHILRRALRRDNALDLVLIVSAPVYEEIVKTRLRELDPDQFCRANIRSKDASFTGYLYQAGPSPAGPKSSSAATLTEPLALQART